MSHRMLGAAILVAALIATPAGAKTPKACKHLHGKAHKTCVRKHAKPKVKPAADIPVTTTLLDGSTITTSTGTFALVGALHGFIPGRVQLNTPSVVTETRGDLTAAGCGAVSLISPSPYSVMVLNADGTVLSTVHLSLPGCGGDATLLLGGIATQPSGLNALVLDTVPGPVTAHLVLKVDLSGKR